MFVSSESSPLSHAVFNAVFYFASELTSSGRNSKCQKVSNKCLGCSDRVFMEVLTPWKANWFQPIRIYGQFLCYIKITKNVEIKFKFWIWASCKRTEYATHNGGRETNSQFYLAFLSTKFKLNYCTNFYHIFSGAASFKKDCQGFLLLSVCWEKESISEGITGKESIFGQHLIFYHCDLNIEGRTVQYYYQNVLNKIIH